MYKNIYMNEDSPLFSCDDDPTCFSNERLYIEYEMRKKLRYFNVLSKHYMTEKERVWIQVMIKTNVKVTVKGKRTHTEDLRRLHVLLAILTLLYQYFSTYNYKKVIPLIKDELGKLRFDDLTSLGGLRERISNEKYKRIYSFIKNDIENPYFELLTDWLKYRSFKVCNDRLQANNPSYVYELFKRIQRRLVSSSYEDVRIAGTYLNRLREISKGYKAQ